MDSGHEKMRLWFLRYLYGNSATWGENHYCPRGTCFVWHETFDSLESRRRKGTPETSTLLGNIAWKLEWMVLLGSMWAWPLALLQQRTNEDQGLERCSSADWQWSYYSIGERRFIFESAECGRDQRDCWYIKNGMQIFVENFGRSSRRLMAHILDARGVWDSYKMNYWNCDLTSWLLQTSNIPWT